MQQGIVLLFDGGYLNAIKTITMSNAMEKIIKFLLTVYYKLGVVDPFCHPIF